MSDKIIKYDDVVVYENGAWVDPAFRDIEITGGEDVTNAALISTLSANSTITPIEPDTPDVPVEPVTELVPFLTNIANAIRAKKGTTAQINAQDFASEIESIEGGAGGVTLKGGWTGTAVPVDTTTTIENIYLNTQLSNEEVASLIGNNSSLFDNDMGCFIACDENQSSILFVVSMEGMYAIMDYTTEYVYFVYSADHQAEIITQFGFSGWNPEFNGNVVFNSINIATTLGMMSSAHIEEVVENFKSLISTTPFEKLNIELSGTYEGKQLTITENETIDLTSNITNGKEIITSVQTNILDYKAGLFGYDLPEEIVLESYSSGTKVCLFDYGISSDEYFSYLLKFTPTLKKLTIKTDTGNSDFKLAQNCFHLETLVFNFKKDNEIRAKGLLKCENVFGLKTLIVNCTDTLETMWFLSLNTFLKDCCYFNGITKNNVFDITYTKGGWSMGTTTYSINPNAEKTGVIYVSDNIYDYVIADEENSNYVSQIKRLSEYVEE